MDMRRWRVNPSTYRAELPGWAPITLDLAGSFFTILSRAKDSDAQREAKMDSDTQNGPQMTFVRNWEDTRILVAAPPDFGLVLRSSNPLIKREVQYMGRCMGNT